MLHNPIKIDHISHSFGLKVCFESFNKQVYPGQKIAIVGRNGSGKSTLLSIMMGAIEPSEGVITGLNDFTIGYVPQTVTDYSDLSGGQRFNKALSQALALNPDMLCLDEPTNHLDQKNRKSLMRMLTRYRGILIVVTHDVELLRNYIDEIWHIEDANVHCFAGTYDEYMQTWQLKREKLEGQLKLLDHNKKQVHIDLMREQKRTKSKKTYGKKKYGAMVVISHDEDFLEQINIDQSYIIKDRKIYEQ